MIVMLSVGEYSDYTVQALYEGEQEDFQKAFLAWRTHPGDRPYGRDAPDLLHRLLGENNCQKLEYREINREYSEDIENFLGLEKKSFIVRVGYQKDVTIDAFTPAEAKKAAQKMKEGGMPARILNVKELGI
jgi:hypothetical protein